MQGYLLKKKEKIGKWKQQFFLLKQDGSDSHLYFYDNPKVRFQFLVSCLLAFTILFLAENKTERPDRPELRVPIPGPRLLLREKVLLPAR